MKHKRVTALFMASLMAAASLGTSTICSAAENEETSAITFPLEETKNFSMLCVINGNTPIEEVDAFKVLNENSNITFDVTDVYYDEAKEKEGLILASGDYPEVFIFSTFSKTEVDKYGAEGVFVPLEDLIKEYAPNLTAYLDENDLWSYVTAPDGHIYSLPAINTNAERAAGFHVWINKTWMNNLGLEDPTNLDEFYEVLKAFKEQDANGNGDTDDEIALSVPDGMNYLDNYLPYFGVNVDMNTWLAVKDGELIYVPTSDEYKEFLKFFKKLYDEGILDPNSFTQNYDQMTSRGSSEDVMGCFSALASFQFVGRDRDEDYITMVPFKEQKYPITTGLGEGCMMITDACEDPATLVAWADQLYSEEGGILYWLGVEGTSYIDNGDGTWSWNIGGPLGDDAATVREKGTLKFECMFPGIQPDIWFTGITDPDEKYLISQRGKMLDYGEVSLPAMSYDTENTDTIASLTADLNTYINQYGAQVIIGEEDLDESWDSYVETLNNMGAAELFDIYQRAFDNAEK